MKYNFDKVINRRNTECIKWDYVGQVFGAEDILPMWVADMDFECPECITEALKARVSHGIYAYTGIPEALYKAVIDWMKKRHGWEIKKEWICFT